MSFPGLRSAGRLRHLLTLEHMPVAVIDRLLLAAQALHADAQGGHALRARLRGLSLCTLFFEPSTRTRSSFQLAAMRLGMDVLNFDPKTSSAGKGESDRDTLATLQAMGINAFAVRHSREARKSTRLNSSH